MQKIPFNVSARTALLIGRENVSNADGAVIELVKNSYDADAKEVFIIFTQSGDLFIIDNGHGMKGKIIQNDWMTIGTDAKELDPYSPNKRVKAGAKGIGRFALDRLGKKVEMYTLPRNQKDGFCWNIDWSDFEKKGATIKDVQAGLENLKGLKLSKKLPTTDIDLGKKIKFPNGGTILKISSLRDQWTEEALDVLYRSLETLVPANDKDVFSVTMLALDFNDKFGLVRPLINDEFDSKISAFYNSKTKQFKVTIERNELDVSLLEKKYKKVFKTVLMKEFPYTFSTYQKGKFSQNYDITDLIRGYTDPKNLLKDIGDFSFDLSFAKNALPNKEDFKKYPYKNADYASRKEWLKKFGGIRIFRDNFRVRPYGDNGDDWLGLGERHAQSPAGAGQGLNGFKLKPNQVAGMVRISRLTNISFQDKSSREGIQENEVFSLFKMILLNLIDLLEKDRNTIFYSLSELYKKTDKNEQAKLAAKEVAANLENKKGGKSKKVQDFQSSAEILADGLKVYENESEKKDEEIKILRSLASSGLITAAVAHELRGLKNILLTRNEELKALLKRYIPENTMNGVKDAFNPYVLLAEMKDTDKDLHEWISYALTPLKRDRRSTKAVALKKYFDSLQYTWEHLLNERKITLTVSGFNENFSIKTFAIDLDTLFNNLIINSIESFSRSKKRDERIITIKCRRNKDFYRITYTDNGAGLDASYKKNPQQIFLPQETTKVDNQGRPIGTGMGMYLVKNVIDDNRGIIEIPLISNGFCIEMSLPIF